ncbi:MAG: flagellar basal body protein [Deltaproteobacteria bacterium]|jgi:flagellar hook protein FlgE|nr:flagellar basal body protein [Deltaproteobacteria bacterium]
MSINSALYPPVTALNAFGVGTQVTANNLANVLTDGFKASRTTYMDLPRYSGVAAQVQNPSTVQNGAIAPNRLETANSGPLIPVQGLPRDPSTPAWVPAGFVEGSNTDVASEMVNLIVTSRGYQANAKIVPTVDSMLGTVIDMKI